MPGSPAPRRSVRKPAARRTPLQTRVADAILDAAGEVIADEGPDASMAAVAAAAGVARATLYRYFPNRASLLGDLGDRAVAAAGARLAAAQLETVDARTAIERAIRALVETGPAFVVVARESEGARPAAYEAEIGGQLRRIFERGQKSGEVRADLAPAFLTDAIVGLIAGVLNNVDPLARENVVAATARVFIEGVGGKLGSTPRSS